MDHTPFILGSYLVTAIVVVIEIVAVRMRMRAAARAAAGDDALPTVEAEPNR